MTQKPVAVLICCCDCPGAEGFDIIANSRPNLLCDPYPLISSSPAGPRLTRRGFRYGNSSPVDLLSGTSLWVARSAANFAPDFALPAGPFSIRPCGQAAPYTERGGAVLSRPCGEALIRCDQRPTQLISKVHVNFVRAAGP